MFLLFHFPLFPIHPVIAFCWELQLPTRWRVWFTWLLEKQYWYEQYFLLALKVKWRLLFVLRGQEVLFWQPDLSGMDHTARHTIAPFTGPSTCHCGSLRHVICFLFAPLAPSVLLTCLFLSLPCYPTHSYASSLSLLFSFLHTSQVMKDLVPYFLTMFWWICLISSCVGVKQVCTNHYDNVSVQPTHILPICVCICVTMKTVIFLQGFKEGGSRN